MAATLEYTLGLEINKALRALQDFQSALVRSRAPVDQLDQSVKKLEGTSKNTGNSVVAMASGLKTAFAGLAIGAAAFEGVRVAADQFKRSIAEAADFEQLKVGFSVLLQSGAKAKAMLADLTKFADTTPFHMPELAQAARTLLAFGDPAQSVMKDLRQLGDVAAGVQAPIGEIAELFGKARSEGVLYSIDIRELTRRGIPIIGELAKMYHVSEDAIRKMTETGSVKFADLQRAMANLTSKGGMFFGMLAAQGETYKGKLTTLGDAWGALQREFGAPVLEPLKAGVGEITTILAGWKTKAQEWGQLLANGLKGALAIINNGDAGAVLGAALDLGFAKAINTLYKGAMATVATLITGMGAAIAVMVKGLANPAVWKVVYDVFDVVANRLGFAIAASLARALDHVPGMHGTAVRIAYGAVADKRAAKKAEAAVQDDLQNTDLTDTTQAVVDATKITGSVFGATYASTNNVVDEDGPRGKATEAMQKANWVNGLPAGDANGTTLTDQTTAMFRGKPPKGSTDDDWKSVPTTVTGPALGNVPPALGSLSSSWINGSSLNDRANSLVGASGRQPDPLLALAARKLQEILDATKDNKPKERVPGSGFN